MSPGSDRLTTPAGYGATGSSKGGRAVRAALDGACGVGVDESGNLFIADFYNSRIREVTG